MHGVGIHPNWTDVVQPIRTQLPEHGWTTLSIQMPILKNEAKFIEYAPLFDEVAPRINAAIALLKKKGHKNIILIGHSLGNDMAVYYLLKDKRASKHIKALVAISFTAPRPTPLPGKNALKLIKNVSTPMYDLYGMDDKDTVPGAALRKKNGRLKGRYDQKGVAGAGHFFRDQNETLMKLIVAWIAAYGK
jgi:pimeloyl-ACP methyl ester carboxylesterase